MQGYSVGLQCRVTVQGYSVGLQCRNTVQGYSVGLQCRVTVRAREEDTGLALSCDVLSIVALPLCPVG